METNDTTHVKNLIAQLKKENKNLDKQIPLLKKENKDKQVELLERMKQDNLDKIKAFQSHMEDTKDLKEQEDAS